MDEYLMYARSVVEEEQGKKRPDGNGCTYRSALAQGMLQVLKDMQRKKEMGVKTIPGPEPVKLDSSLLVTKWTDPPVEDTTMIHMIHPDKDSELMCGVRGDNASAFFDEVTCFDCLYEYIAMQEVAKRLSESTIAAYKEEHAVVRCSGVALDDLLDLLEDLAYQTCIAAVSDKGVTFDSMAISAYRDLLLTLAEHGRVSIENQSGRRVIATKVD